MQALYLDLKGRTALVTGASSGIGYGIAEALLVQGVRVVLQYKSREKEAAALAARFPGAAFPVRANLGTEQGCISLYGGADYKRVGISQLSGQAILNLVRGNDLPAGLLLEDG